MTQATEGARVNGYDLAELRGYIESIRRDPSVADRDPVVRATWLGGSRARVEDGSGLLFHVGGDGEPSAMRALLGTLAACDVEVVSTHAALLGVKLEGLEVEARTHFNVAKLLGLEGPDPGFERVSYTVRVSAPGATREQLERLREMCETASPVGHTLARPVPLTLEFVHEA